MCSCRFCESLCECECGHTVKGTTEHATVRETTDHRPQQQHRLICSTGAWLCGASKSALICGSKKGVN